jgi:hypothetical protein
LSSSRCDSRKMNISVSCLCGGETKIIACIEAPEIIEQILSHLDTKSEAPANHLPKCRTPPQRLLLNSGSSEN